MKKLTVITLCLCLVAGAFSGCAYAPKEAPDDTLRVVTTIFPVYDWTRNILGNCENVELTLLLDNRVDLHSYQPTAEDIVKIAECDLFIYLGGESDDWVDDALRETENENRIAVRLMDGLGNALKLEETVEGMQVDETEDEASAEYDEHIWLSLRNAAELCPMIASALGKADPEHKDLYLENSNAYCGKLHLLSTAYQAAVDNGYQDTLLFGDRFPFRYLVEDYGLNYYAAFSGCSAETEASFETILFLANKVNELGLTTILALDGGDGEIARTVRDTASASGIVIRYLDSMQGTTLADAAAGMTYLSIMEDNLNVLRETLK